MGKERFCGLDDNGVPACQENDCCRFTCELSGFADPSSCATGADFDSDWIVVGYLAHTQLLHSPRCAGSLYVFPGEEFLGKETLCWTGACQSSDCCRHTCSAAGYSEGGAKQCPTGMFYRTSPANCPGNCLAEYACKTGNCSDAECCSVPRVPSSSDIGTCWNSGFRDSTVDATDGAHRRSRASPCCLITAVCFIATHRSPAAAGTFPCSAGLMVRMTHDEEHVDEHAIDEHAIELFESDCCAEQCWTSGWRDHGDSSGTSICPVSSSARDKDSDATCLRNKYGVCDKYECCTNSCWASGWRDDGDSSGLHECPTGQVARGITDVNTCDGGVCTESECCSGTCASIPPESCSAKGLQLRTGRDECRSGACSVDECCLDGCQAWSDAGNTCAAPTPMTRPCPSVKWAAHGHMYILQGVSLF